MVNLPAQNVALQSAGSLTCIPASYVPDNSIIFNKGVDSDNIKVLLSRRSPEEKSFLKNNIGQLVAFGRDYFVEEKEKEMSAERREALQPFIDTEKYGLGFIKYNATEGYSSTGAYFEIFNPSKKTISFHYTLKKKS